MTKKPMDNSTVFNYPQPLSLPGFSKQESFVDKHIVFPPDNIPVSEWYEDFRIRFFDALDNGKKFPVFRSSHGEIGFVTGKMGTPKGSLKAKIRFFLSRIYRIIYFQSFFYSSGVPGHGYETYKQWKLPGLRKKFAIQVKWIADNGVLCMYFADRGAYSISYQKAYLKWLNKQEVYLNRENYGHIYFVYALLNGYDKERVFKNRRMLVVSSDQPTRTPPLIKNLLQLGAISVDFISISPGSSMNDTITVEHTDYDLCIVGAGVGAANIIYQLRELYCPVIDAGFIIDQIAYPDKVKPRIYTVNDRNWETLFPDNNPEWKPVFSDHFAEKVHHKP